MDGQANGTTLAQAYKENQPLTVAEAQRLAALEEVICKNFQGFYAVGCALREIRDAKLYREKFRTFEEYCKNVWDTGVRSVERYITAASVIENIEKHINKNATHGSQNENVPDSTAKKVVFAPKNERQVRPLTRKELSADDQITCWMMACEKAAEAGKQVSAYYVEQAVVEFLGGRAKRQLKNAVGKLNRGGFTLEFRQALAPVVALVRKAAASGWKGCDRDKMLRFVDELRAIIAGE